MPSIASPSRSAAVSHRWRRGHIEDSYIGPYTSIGDDITIIESELKYSVIMQNAQIKGIERITDSLVGRYAKITRGDDKRRTIRLSVGDHSEITL